MKTLDIDECAEFLKIDSTAVSEMAIMGELPGARIGQAWVFLEEDLVEYVRSQVRAQRRARQLAMLERNRNAGADVDQDVLAKQPTVLRNRRSQRDIPPGLTSGEQPFLGVTEIH